MNYPPEIEKLIKSCKWPRYSFTLESDIAKKKLLDIFPEEKGKLILNPHPFTDMKQEASNLKNIKNVDYIKLEFNS